MRELLQYKSDSYSVETDNITISFSDLTGNIVKLGYICEPKGVTDNPITLTINNEDKEFVIPDGIFEICVLGISAITIPNRVMVDGNYEKISWQIDIVVDNGDS